MIMQVKKKNYEKFGNSWDNPRRSLVRMETERFIIETNIDGRTYLLMSYSKVWKEHGDALVRKAIIYIGSSLLEFV